jgi:hypothetical protein
LLLFTQESQVNQCHEQGTRLFIGEKKISRREEKLIHIDINSRKEGLVVIVGQRYLRQFDAALIPYSEYLLFLLRFICRSLRRERSEEQACWEERNY